ncbi:hypothetical protein BP5796_10257 [Coleophoma crateriformis]|uniref:Heterokaryon incompatibility domain-containing protein n=1 Tax=Coleophoma crateriformis TaxID=565419 RepID=A0A3D8QUW3_9HELO|nr:hypothetical protein BP5796_10257 [Coleophoma crateriformis]
METRSNDIQRDRTSHCDLMHQQYVYPALPADGNTIRVINILPGSANEKIACTVQHIQLNQEPQYEAISYCWGDPSPYGEILCDGKLLTIAKSLYMALLQIRDSVTSRTLWADGICINQNDVDEKNTQVPLMRQIYEKAAQVVVWLGEEADNSQLAFRLIPKLFAANKKREALGDKRTYLHLQDMSMELIYDLPKRHGGDDFPAYFRLFNRPWFVRGWVVQEIAVAKKIVVYCGSSTADWDEFMLGLIFVQEMDILPTSDLKSVSRLLEMGLTRQAFQKGYPASVLMLLLRHKSTLVTDPRDKIYAISGMAVDSGPTSTYENIDGLDIRPDYRAPVEVVYQNLARDIMVKEHVLGLLNVPRKPNTDSNLNLPSWVPDLSDPAPTASLMGLDYNIHYMPLYSAAQTSQCSPRFSIDGRELCLEGFVFDTIIELGDVEPVAGLGSGGLPTLEDFKEIYARHRRRYQRRQLAGLNDGIFWQKKYVTGEKLQDVYWNILIAGYHPSPEIKPEYMVDMKKAWFKKYRKTDWLGRLPFPLFEVSLIAGIILKSCWLFFRLTLWLAFWTPDPPFEQIMGHQADRRIFKTKKKYLGLACSDAQPGDMIAVFKGGRLPLVIRSGGSKWRLIGDSYLHGIMKGEAFEDAKCGNIWLI